MSPRATLQQKTLEIRDDNPESDLSKKLSRVYIVLDHFGLQGEATCAKVKDHKSVLLPSYGAIRQ